MTFSSSGPTPGRRPSSLILLLLVAFAVIATAFCVVPIINHLHKVRRGEHGTKDYPLWYESGNLELHGKTPYYEGSFHEYPFMYPPGAAVILAVLSIGGRIPLMVMQVLINTAAWGLAIVLPVYLLTGKWKPGDVPRDRWSLMFWVPSVVCLLYIWDTYLEGQVAFILSVLLLLMFVSLRHRNSWGAGLSLALAAGLKGFPILAFPYLIWRREWKAIGYTALFSLLLMLVFPAMFRGPAGAMDDLKAWSINMMAKQTPEVIGQRAARSYTWQNGSLTSVTHRLLRHVVADRDDNQTTQLYVNVANIKFETINKIVDVIAVVLGLAYVAVMPWKDAKRTPLTDTIEASMLLILVILFAPLSFTYNNSWLMCPIAVVLYFVTSKARSRPQAIFAGVWLAIALSLLIFSIPNPAFRVPRAIGNTFFADVLVLIELGWILWLEQRPAVVQPRVVDEHAAGVFEPKAVATAGMI